MFSTDRTQRELNPHAPDAETPRGARAEMVFEPYAGDLGGAALDAFLAGFVLPADHLEPRLLASQVRPAHCQPVPLLVLGAVRGAGYNLEGFYVRAARPRLAG